MEESYGVDLSACRFCDCMGLHLQVGIIAASFPFRKLLSIELDDELASGALHKLTTSEFGKKSCPVSYEVGFFKVSIEAAMDMASMVIILILDLKIDCPHIPFLHCKAYPHHEPSTISNSIPPTPPILPWHAMTGLCGTVPRHGDAVPRLQPAGHLPRRGHSAEDCFQVLP